MQQKQEQKGKRNYFSWCREKEKRLWIFKYKKVSIQSNSIFGERNFSSEKLKDSTMRSELRTLHSHWEFVN